MGLCMPSMEPLIPACKNPFRINSAGTLSQAAITILPPGCVSWLTVLCQSSMASKLLRFFFHLLIWVLKASLSSTAMPNSSAVSLCESVSKKKKLRTSSLCLMDTFLLLLFFCHGGCLKLLKFCSLSNNEPGYFDT